MAESNIKILNNFQKAIAALPTILLIGGIIVEIGIAGAFLAYFFSQSGYGIKQSAEALSAANSGIQDAVMRIIRNGASVPGSYQITVSNLGGTTFTSASTTICKNSTSSADNPSCDTPIAGKYEITSVGVYSSGNIATKERRLRAIVNVNGFNNEVKVESIKEISAPSY